MYELHIYGGDNIAETRDDFETKKAAMEEADSRCSGDTTDWMERYGHNLVKVDNNHNDDPDDTVIMVVKDK